MKASLRVFHFQTCDPRPDGREAQIKKGKAEALPFSQGNLIIFHWLIP